MGVMRFCFWCSCTMGAGCAGCPGDCVWGGMTGEAAGGTAGGAGEGRPVGCGGISFCGALVGAAAFAIGPGGERAAVGRSRAAPPSPFGSMGSGGGRGAAPRETPR